MESEENDSLSSFYRKTNQVRSQTPGGNTHFAIEQLLVVVECDDTIFSTSSSPLSPASKSAGELPLVSDQSSHTRHNTCSPERGHLHFVASPTAWLTVAGLAVIVPVNIIGYTVHHLLWPAAMFALTLPLSQTMTMCKTICQVAFFPASVGDFCVTFSSRNVQTH